MDTIKKAFVKTIPVLTGYVPLGIGFGILLQKNGYGLIWALCMSITMYAGSMQYAAVGLLASAADPVTVFLTTLLVNGRHLFYGISLIDRYKKMGWRKPFLIFGLTDESYALEVSDNSHISEEEMPNFFIALSWMDHCYWIIGCLLGVIIGSLIPYNMEGIDFVLTALFVTIVTDQWLKNKNHIPALLGFAGSTIALIIFGSGNMLIPSMGIILVCLLSMGKFTKWEVPNE